MVVKSDILKNACGAILCDEFYYVITKNFNEVKEWLDGMKLVYTADENDSLDFDYAVEMMDDDQEMMAETITKVVCEINPDFIINEIYVNHNHNSDGSKNLIKVICISFLMPNGEFLVCKAPFYAFTKEAWKFCEEN